MHQSLRFIAVV